MGFMIETSTFGHLPDGQEVRKYTIRQEDGTAVSILSYGAIIQEFLVPCKDGLRNIVFSSPDLAGYIGDSSYKGQCVAPYANRIKAGRFSLDGSSYQLDINNGLNNLHSGSANLGQVNWDLVFQTDDSIMLNTGHKDGDGGFPGNIGVTLTYTLSGGTLSLLWQLSSDKRCVVNPTNHSYFNLKGDGSSIFDHEVRIDADRVVAVGADLIPTEVMAVAGTDFDFQAPHLVGERRDGRYDHCFVFSSKPGRAVVRAAGLKLSVETDRPGMQLYTGEFNPVCASSWPQTGPFCALALETSAYPDAVNRPEFPSVVLEAGEVLKTWTRYTLEVE